jgi:hypothetical protein
VLEGATERVRLVAIVPCPAAPELFIEFMGSHMDTAEAERRQQKAEIIAYLQSVGVMDRNLVVPKM